MRKFMKRAKNESGQVLVLAALLMTVLIGFAALAVDIGMVTVTKSKLQNAADEAIKLAKLNEVDGTGTTIDVVVNTAAAATEVTNEKVEYTADELADIKAELTADINNMTDLELIAYA